jgi:hypothetical protein
MFGERRPIQWTKNIARFVLPKEHSFYVDECNHDACPSGSRLIAFEFLLDGDDLETRKHERAQMMLIDDSEAEGMADCQVLLLGPEKLNLADDKTQRRLSTSWKRRTKRNPEGERVQEI